MRNRASRAAFREAIAIAALLPAAPLPHEGHGRADLQSSPLHYLIEPQHALPLLLALIGSALAVAWLWRRTRAAARLQEEALTKKK